MAMIWQVLPNDHQKTIERALEFSSNYVDKLADKEYAPLKKLLLRYKKTFRRFIDGGASYGWWSLYFKDMCENIECFEIREDVYECLHENLNNFNVQNANLHNNGLSSYDGTAYYAHGYIKDVFKSERTEVRKRSGVYKGRDHKLLDFKHKCKVSRLDTYAFDDVDLLKLDIEQHEYDALKGATQTIQRNRPICVIEINVDALILSEIILILKYFDRHNYMLRKVLGIDYVFVPNEMREL